MDISDMVALRDIYIQQAAHDQLIFAELDATLAESRKILIDSGISGSSCGNTR